MLIAHAEVATTLVKAAAKSSSDVAVLAIALRGLAEVHIQLAALELASQEHVVHAGDGARAVSGRSTAGHNVHALDEHRRNEVEIDAITLVGGDEAAAIDQVQRAAAKEWVQTTQVGDGRTGEKVGVAGGGRRVVRHVRRQRLDRITHVHNAHVLEVVGIHDRGRVGGVEVSGALDARACDLHFVELLFSRKGLRSKTAEQSSAQCSGNSGAYASGVKACGV